MSRPSDRPQPATGSSAGDRMTPNSSAIVAVIEHKWVAEFQRELESEEAHVVREVIGEDLAAQLGEGTAVTHSAAEVEGDVVATRSTVPQPRLAEEPAAMEAKA